MRPRIKMNGPLLWSALSIAAAMIAVLFVLGPVLAAAFSSGGEVDEVDRQLSELVAKHTEAQKTYSARFNGRSIFFKPPQPAPPAPVRVEKPDLVEVVDPGPPPPPPPPTIYNGPAIQGIMGDTVVFKKGTPQLMVKVGEKKDGIEVIATRPFSAELAYDGWQGEVKLFNNTIENAFKDGVSGRGGLDGRVQPAGSNGETTAAPNPETNDPESNNELLAGERAVEASASESSRPIRPRARPRSSGSPEVPE